MDESPFVTQDLALSTASTNCNPKHLFIYLTQFRSQRKASPCFLPYILKIKGKSIQIQWICVGGPTASLGNDHCFGEEDKDTEAFMQDQRQIKLSNIPLK